MLDDKDTFETTSDLDCWCYLHDECRETAYGSPWAITKNGNLSLYQPDWVWGAFNDAR